MKKLKFANSHASYVRSVPWFAVYALLSAGPSFSMFFHRKKKVYWLKP